MTEVAQARHNMIENQLRPSRITDPRLLEAMGTVPRENFLPKRLRGVAYIDEDIDLGNGRHLIEPLALAKMLEAAGPSNDEVLLVIGCDTGYSAAIASRLAATVFHLASETDDVEAIERLLEEVGCDNVVVQSAEPAKGLEAQAPFGVILIAGGVAEVPAQLADQLEDGGRLVCVVTDGRSGKVTIRRRVGNAFGDTTPFDAWVPRLVSLAPEPAFSL